jgi:rhodanese-related sulfurtransferase
MKWIPKQALWQGIIILLVATFIGLGVNSFHPKKVRLAFQRPPLKYAADSLFAEDLPSVNIAGQNDSVPPTPNASGELIILNAGQLRQLVSQQQAMLLDARTPAEYEAGHLPGAMLLPFDLLYDYEQQINELPKDKWLICYCEGPPCDLGELLAKELLLRGFQKVAVYQDGVNDWKKSYPVIKGKEAGEFEK